MILINSLGLIGDSIVKGFYSILLFIDSVIYSFVTFFYKTFLAISTVQLFDSSTFNELTQRLYIIIGVVMMFVVAFSLIKGIVDPDKAFGSDAASSTTLLKNIITSLILLVLIGTIFNYAYKITGVIIADNTIGKIILGAEEIDDNNFFNSAANEFSVGVFSVFFFENESNVKGTGDHGGKTLSMTRQEVIDNGNFGAFGDYVDAVSKGKITYYILFSTVAGAFMCYIFLSYCIDMGLRIIKLIWYQLIAPIPILSRIIPGQSDIFSKWVKATVTTFLEVFIRLLIVFFGLFVIKSFQGANLIWDDAFMGKPDDFIILLVWLAVIIGILMFIKKAPQLIGDMFGIDSSSMGFGIKDKLAGMAGGKTLGKGAGKLGNLANKGLGAATGALGGGLANKRNGGSFKDGAKSGAVNGADAGGNQFSKQKQALYEANGGAGKANLTGSGRSRTDAKKDEWKKGAGKNASDRLENLRTDTQRTLDTMPEDFTQSAQYTQRMNSNYQQAAANNEQLRELNDQKALQERILTSNKANADKCKSVIASLRGKSGMGNITPAELLAGKNIEECRRQVANGQANDNIKKYVKAYDQLKECEKRQETYQNNYNNTTTEINNVVDNIKVEAKNMTDVHYQSDAGQQEVANYNTTRTQIKGDLEEVDNALNRISSANNSRDIEKAFTTLSERFKPTEQNERGE